MATKDWKKVAKNKFVGKKFILYIIPAINLGGRRYFVSFTNLDDTFRTNTPNTKVFNNESTALKYAKSYMRKH